MPDEFAKEILYFMLFALSLCVENKRKALAETTRFIQGLVKR